MRNTPPLACAMAMGTKKRSVAPLSPQSIMGEPKVLRLAPRMVRVSSFRENSAPSDLRQRRVAAMSSDSIKPSSTVSPCERPAQIIRRCASDLDAGAASVPDRQAGCNFRDMGVYRLSIAGIIISYDCRLVLFSLCSDFKAIRARSCMFRLRVGAKCGRIETINRRTDVMTTCVDHADITRLAAALGEAFPEMKLTEAAPMSRYTTLRLGGPADLLAEPYDAASLAGTLRMAGEYGTTKYTTLLTSFFLYK